MEENLRQFMPFPELLDDLGACIGARKWVGSMSLRQAWDKCLNPDWMLWLCIKAAVEQSSGWPNLIQVLNIWGQIARQPFEEYFSTWDPRFDDFLRLISYIEDMASAQNDNTKLKTDFIFKQAGYFYGRFGNEVEYGCRSFVKNSYLGFMAFMFNDYNSMALRLGYIIGTYPSIFKKASEVYAEFIRDRLVVPLDAYGEGCVRDAIAGNKQSDQYNWCR